MTSIDGLSIRGIRSFPPEEESKLFLKDRPLCIVQGMNGCGKTTIIECLKYATTGSLPPGSSNGQSFIHDPKIANAPEVKAQVKVLLRGSGRRKLMVSRNLQLTQKRNKLEFKQLEGVLQSRDSKGQKQEISSKCAELDKSVPAFMGVSKAILENVIFCHQEESLWPLMESSVLKKKFDEIFESTRYNKALEEVKKQRKRLTALAKSHETEWKVLEVTRKNAFNLEDQAESVRESLEEASDRAESARAEMEELEQQEAEIMSLMSGLEEESNELYSLEVEGEQLQKMSQTEWAALEREYPEDYKLLVNLKLDGICELLDAEARQRVIESRERERAEEDLNEVTRKLDKVGRSLHELDKRRAGLEATQRMQAEAEDRLIGRLARFYRDNLQSDKETLELLETERRAVQGSVGGGGGGSSSSSGSSNAAGPETSQGGGAGLAWDAEAMARRARVLRKAISGLKAHVEATETTVGQRTATSEEKVEAKRAEVSKLQSNHSVVAAEFRKSEAQVAELEREVAEINQAIRGLHGVSDMEARLSALDQQLERAEADRTRAEDDAEGARSAAKLEANRAASDSATEELRELEREVANLEGRQEQLIQFREKAKRVRESYTTLIINAENVQASLKRVEGNTTERDLAATAAAAGGKLHELAQRRPGGIREQNAALSEQVDLAKGVERKLLALRDAHTRHGQDLDAAARALENEVRDLRRHKHESAERQQSLKRELADLARVSDDLSQVGIAALEQAGGADAPGAVEAVREALQNEVYALSETVSDAKNVEMLARKQLGKVFSSRKRRAREAGCPTSEAQGECPTCQRSFEADYRLPGEQQDMLKLFDRDGRLLRDIDFAGKFGSMTVELKFQCGDKLRGTDYFLAVVAAAAAGSAERQRDAETAAQRLQLAKEELGLFERELVGKLRRRGEAQAELAAAEAAQEEAETELGVKDGLLQSKKNEQDQLGTAHRYTDKALGAAQDAKRELEATFLALEEACKLAEAIGLGEAEQDAAVSAGGGADRGAGPLEVARQAVRDKSGELRQLQREREQLLEQRDRAQRRLQELVDSVTQLQQEKMALREGAKQLEALQASKAAKTAARKACDAAVDELRIKLASAARAQQDTLEELELLRAREADALKGVRDVLDLARKELSVAQSEHEAISKRGSSAVAPDKELLELGEAEASLQASRLQLEKEVASFQRVLDQAKEKARAGESSSHKLQRFSEARSRADRVLELEGLAEELRARIGDRTLKSLEFELRRHRKAMTKVSNHLSRVEGEEGALQRQLAELEAQLRQDEYRDVDRRYKGAAIRFQTTQMAAADLDTYYGALDTALMQFHQQKIEEINRNIGQLWPIVYQGGDIERIALRSEKTTTGKSRSFNYKVVMTKGGTELEMRGRCSAGQKMMASLVIRMALAESFSVNCGILALDEPTTNLDEKNRKGLATALVNVIRQFSNMQLIVITHDADFVQHVQESLAAAHQSAYYYRVRRELNAQNKFVSRIEDADL